MSEPGEIEELTEKLDQAIKRLRNAALDFEYSDHLFRFVERVELLLAMRGVQLIAKKLEQAALKR